MPLLTPRHHPRVHSRPSRSPGPGAPPLPPRANRTHPVVLLVDDDSSVLEGLRRVFAQEGLQVIAAHNGEQALEQLNTVRPDLVVTDLCMGAVSGWDLVFHHHLHEAGLPFIVITALSVTEAGGVEKFAAGFFQKPLNLEALLAAIHARLGSCSAASAEKTSVPKP